MTTMDFIGRTPLNILNLMILKKGITINVRLGINAGQDNDYEKGRL